MTLEQIIKAEELNTKKYKDHGIYGIEECKKAIAWEIENEKTDLYVLLKEYVARANEDIFFNRRMVLACWQMINEE